MQDDLWHACGVGAFSPSLCSVRGSVRSQRLPCHREYDMMCMACWIIPRCNGEVFIRSAVLDMQLP